MSAQDEEKIRYMLSERVGPATLAGYNRHGLSEWLKFLRDDRKWSAANLSNDSSVGLQRSEDSDESRIKLFILYVYYLRQCGVTDVSLRFKALGHDFISKGWLALAELLKSPLVMVARSHGERGRAREIAAARSDNEKQAVSGNMLMSLYDIEWCGALNSSDVLVIDRAVACLMGWLMVQFGLRISNLAKTESDAVQLKARILAPEGSVGSGVMEESLDRHAMRAEDVGLQLDGVMGLVNAFEYSNGHVGTLVSEIIINVVTSKVNQTANRRVQFHLRRDSVGETRLLEMLVIFICFAKYDGSTDMLFSRPHASRIRGSLLNPELGSGEKRGRFRYQQDVVNELVKNCALRFGLDPKSFSTKSFKNCGITSAQMVRDERGMTEKEVAKQFDHSSVSSNRHYQRSDLSAQGPLSLITKDGNRLYDHNNLVIQSKLSKWSRK